MFVLPQDHNRRVTRGYSVQSAKLSYQDSWKIHSDESSHKRIASRWAHIYIACPYKDWVKVDTYAPTSPLRDLKCAPYKSSTTWERKSCFSFFLSLPRVWRPTGFLSLTTTSLFNVVDCADQTNSRIIRFRRFRSTARLTNFLATAMPKSGFAPCGAPTRYIPQDTFVLGRVFSNSEILALFNG